MKGKPTWQKPDVIFQPEVYKSIQSGVNQIVDAIAPTLGPTPRIVLYDTTVGVTGRQPELLDNGGIIARRILGLTDRDEDIGAMLLRHMLWRQHEDVGDGTATAAVIFQSVFNEGVRYIAAEGNAMRLRVHLQRGLQVILDELNAMKIYLQGKVQLARLAESICYNAELAKLMGEIFDIIGEYGRLEIRSSRGREMEREYVEGMYWDSGVLSRSTLEGRERLRVDVENPALLLTNFDIEDPRDLVPAFAAVVSQNIESLVIVARKFSQTVMGFIATNQQQQRIKADIIGVKTPGMAITDQRAAVMDMAVLTGGHPFMDVSGEKLRTLRPGDLGHARRVWADKSYTGIIGGRGDPRELRQHIAGLRTAYARTDESEPQEREKLQQRIGKLMGGSATLYVGGYTKPEIDFNKEQAKRTAEAMRGAIREGVVPGGGVGLLNCRPALQKCLDKAEEPEERAAYRILIQGVEAPFRTLLENAGIEPGTVFAKVNRAGAGCGMDVRSGKIVNMVERGLYDPATVTITSTANAVRTAALALTTDVIVHRRNPPDSFDTG